MIRYLKLNKYRNLGLKEIDTLILNHGLDKKNIGDVVILIGSNNSGKSNVLDALHEITTQRLNERDKTTLSFETNDLKTKIIFGIKDDEASLEYEVSLDGTKCTNKFKKIINESFNYDDFIIEFKNLISSFNNYFPNYPYGQQCLEQLNHLEDKSEENISSLIDECLNKYRSRNYNYFINVINTNKLNNVTLKEIISKLENDTISQANSYIQSKYGMPFVPKIITYEEKKLDQGDLETSTNNLPNSLFFRSVFKAIDIDPKVIENAYSQYRTFRNKATLNKIKKEIDKKIAKLSEEFNKMYFAEKDQYHFAIELDDNNISFSMSRGDDEEPIMISYQSTGFRWFFNLFFNFLSSNELHYGDIIIMDEPATNLHPQGQQELHRFLKEFSIKNGLTFVIATHSPFLIDTDNFDELRIVKMENNQSTVCNLFTAMDIDDPDSLKPIKESLTIKQNVFYDLDTQVVLVEGITDYNYLTFFKNALGYKDIAFLPFQGVGNNEKNQTKILKELLKIRFHKRSLLLDGDKAGISLKEKCKNTDLEDAICITDIFKDKEEIEDLFSKEDRTKFDVLNVSTEKYKKAYCSSLLKKTSSLDDFSEETINNFKTLFERLID